jgi:DNA-binding NtrC family response regulator
MHKIFVIDDEPNIRITLTEALEGEGFQVASYANPLDALAALPKDIPEAIITDLKMSELDGIEVIHKVKAVNPEINVVVITGHASLDSAIGAIRAGASDYLVKPFKIDELLKTMKKTMSQRRLIPEKSAKQKLFQERYHIKNLIGTTPEMKEIFHLIEKVAKTDSTVLVIGESGAGKEVAARAIHYQSKRSKGPFVSINCAALPENLLESELFGYEKGAFTGAQASKMGLFELAEGGTFFLDEIGEMSVNLQVKLLRVLQERVLKRVGGIKDISVDFRLICATSKNLPEEIRANRFREDLFYRINVIPILMPPLRKRIPDVPLFVRYFLDYYAQKHDRKEHFTMTPEAMAVLEQHSWPGNIRELENVIERIVALAETDVIDEKVVEEALVGARLPRPYSSKAARPITNKTDDLKEATESYERNLIEQALVESQGSKSKAAKKLNLTRQSLQYKINKYGIKNE